MMKNVRNRLTQPVLPMYEKAYEMRMDNTMKIKPFINTLLPKNKSNRANAAIITVIEIFVLTATVFSKLALPLPVKRKMVDTIKIPNKKIIFKLKPFTENLIEVK